MPDHETAVFINASATTRAAERLRWLYGVHSVRVRAKVERGATLGSTIDCREHGTWKIITESDVHRLGLM